MPPRAIIIDASGNTQVLQSGQMEEWEPPQGWRAWTEELDLLQWVPRPVFSRPDCLGSLGRDSYLVEPYWIDFPHRVHIGDNCVVGERAVLSLASHEDSGREPELRIGDEVGFGANAFIGCVGDVEIGDRTGFSARVTVGGADSDHADPSPVRIGSGVVVGAGATILPGVTIGDRAFIGAGTVVTRDVPPRSVVFGNPGWIIRSWDERASKWRVGGG
jgi:acetyltransferase-like isoleucine patch superfamily enzyme